MRIWVARADGRRRNKALMRVWARAAEKQKGLGVCWGGVSINRSLLTEFSNFRSFRLKVAVNLPNVSGNPPKVAAKPDRVGVKPPKLPANLLKLPRGPPRPNGA